MDTARSSLVHLPSSLNYAQIAESTAARRVGREISMGFSQKSTHLSVFFFFKSPNPSSQRTWILTTDPWQPSRIWYTAEVLGEAPDVSDRAHHLAEAAWQSQSGRQMSVRPSLLVRIGYNLLTLKSML